MSMARAKERLVSKPVPVRFAGFTSTTMQLANSGWDLSISQQLNIYQGWTHMQLALRHEGAGLYAYTHRMEIDSGDIAEAFHTGRSEAILQRGFDIAYVGANVAFRVQPVQGISARSFMDDFHPMDPYPQYEEVSMKDFKFFKTANPSIKDIVITNEMVPEILDKLLAAQRPMQDQIRARNKSRENYDAHRGIKPAHMVQAQIITLAG